MRSAAEHEFLACRQHFLFRGSPAQRVFVLDCRGRPDVVCAPTLVGTCGNSISNCNQRSSWPATVAFQLVPNVDSHHQKYMLAHMSGQIAQVPVWVAACRGPVPPRLIGRVPRGHRRRRRNNAAKLRPDTWLGRAERAGLVARRVSLESIRGRSPQHRWDIADRPRRTHGAADGGHVRQYGTLSYRGLPSESGGAPWLPRSIASFLAFADCPR